MTTPEPTGGSGVADVLTHHTGVTEGTRTPDLQGHNLTL